MLQLNDITLRRGIKVLLSHSNLCLNTGYKAGLIGRNGAGKTSLLKLIMGELQEDHGDILVPKTWQISHLAQELPATEQSSFAYVRAGDAAWLLLKTKINQAETNNDGHKLAELYHELDIIDGYRIDSKVATILKGLGFSEAEYTQPVSSFSGGWQMRLQLARILMSRADLLLLDEPTNHLDLESILWLQTWLSSYTGTIIVISHDRDFLDHVTSHTIYLAQQKLKLYQGNYSSFARQFQEALLLQEKMSQKIIKQRQHLQKFVDRFKAKASKAKQAQSRVKAIEKLSISTDLQAEQGVSFQFRESSATGYPTISIRADLGYAEKIILNNVRLNIGDGDRIGVIGVNGSGKSTLLKSIAQQLKLVHGEINYHPKTHIGYFSQQQVDMLHLDETPLDHLLQQDKKLSESKARTYLGSFGFDHDRVFDQVQVFSGGEKARLALALLIWQQPNVLVLDEPTNHLDMHVREALILALQDFAGAVLLVSHDRYFIECCANELWLVKQGLVTHYPGNLEDYQASKQAEFFVKKEPPKTKPTNKPSNQNQNKNKKLIKQLERDIKKLQQEILQLDTQLADPQLYQGEHTEQVQALAQQQKDKQAMLEEKELQWLNLSENS